MKHVIGKRNGKTIVSGGGSLEEQKNNLKHWEVLDSVDGGGPKANFAITDPVYYIDKSDIYTTVYGDYFKTIPPDKDRSEGNTPEEMLQGNKEGDNYRIYKGVGILGGGYPMGTTVKACVSIGIADYDDYYKNVIDYQKNNFPQKSIKRSELFKNKYPELNYIKYCQQDFAIGVFGDEAQLSTDANVTEFGGAHRITATSYDSMAYPLDKTVDYILTTNPDKTFRLNKLYDELYAVILAPSVVVSSNPYTPIIVK